MDQQNPLSYCVLRRESPTQPQLPDSQSRKQIRSLERRVQQCVWSSAGVKPRPAHPRLRPAIPPSAETCPAPHRIGSASGPEISPVPPFPRLLLREASSLPAQCTILEGPL